MGNDSITFERSLWIRNIIADIMLEECRCHLYNLGALSITGSSCLRCDNLRRADRLWPVEYARAIQSVQDWQSEGGA